MTPLGMAFLDNAGNWLSECPEGRVQCLQVARKRANQITVHYTVDVMSLSRWPQARKVRENRYCAYEYPLHLSL